MLLLISAVAVTTVLASLSVTGTAVGAGLCWIRSRIKASRRAQDHLRAELRMLLARQAELERELERLLDRRDCNWRSRGQVRDHSGKPASWLTGDQL
jgi:hypothetical protein